MTILYFDSSFEVDTTKGRVKTYITCLGGGFKPKPDKSLIILSNGFGK